MRHGDFAAAQHLLSSVPKTPLKKRRKAVFESRVQLLKYPTAKSKRRLIRGKFIF
jgi:hypothetical protein